MTYYDLKALCEQRKIFIKDVCKEIRMSQPGLRDALNKDTLPVKKLVMLCRMLQISPNRFIYWADNNTSTNYTAMQVGMMNNQNVGTTGIELLQKQLEEKDRQIYTKDSQIDRLLNLLNSKR